MRPREVFVRSLSHQEATRLKRLSTRAEHQSTRIRAAILLASNVKTPAGQIARMWLTDESHVRKVIHEFNEEGFDSLRPEYRGGRPRRITPAERKRAVAVAGARPDTQGVPLTRWSLDRLSAYLAEQGVLISPIHLWRLLDEAGLSFQRTRSWKASPDPDYEARAARVLELYAAAPFDGPVMGGPDAAPGGEPPFVAHQRGAQQVRLERRRPAVAVAGLGAPGRSIRGGHIAFALDGSGRHRFSRGRLGACRAMPSAHAETRASSPNSWLSCCCRAPVATPPAP